MIQISKRAAMDLMAEISVSVYQQELYNIENWAEQNNKDFDIEFYLDDDRSIVVHWVSNGKQVGESVRLGTKSMVGKLYPFRESSDEVRIEMINVLEKGLGRSLTGQEVKTIYWLGDCEYETVGVLLDFFKELSKKGSH